VKSLYIFGRYKYTNMLNCSSFVVMWWKWVLS